MENDRVAQKYKSEISMEHKLVPWSSWGQWDFVRHLIFSSDPYSVAAALRRVVAWRSRGCLPVAVDVTASIVEIQQKDPYFREGIQNDALNSEVMLSMLYCMSIMRLVNGFVEPAHKKTGRSISDLADDFGIPRMLVDIRHESSHRSLPSLPLVRLASVKVLDWLRSNYWEPQKIAIPDIHEEIKCKIAAMIYHLKRKNSQKSSSLTKGKGCKQVPLRKGLNMLSSVLVGSYPSKSDGIMKQISKISKVISQICSAHALEVALVLLEFIGLHASDLSDTKNMEVCEDVMISEPGSTMNSVEILKTVIERLSHKRPRLLLCLIKLALEKIELEEPTIHKRENSLSLLRKTEVHQNHQLRSLLPWLLLNLKALMGSGLVRLADRNQVISLKRSAPPRVSLVKLLQKCISLSTSGDKHLLDSVLIVGEMMGNNHLTERLQKLLLCGSYEVRSSKLCAHTDTISISREEDFLKNSADELEFIKLRLRNRKMNSSDPNAGNTNAAAESKDTKKRRWNLINSWTYCPIGTLPCFISSTAGLPTLEIYKDGSVSKKAKTSCDKVGDVAVVNIDNTIGNVIQTNEDANPNKRLKQIEEVEMQDSLKMDSPMEGRLLINGFWKKVNEEELLAIQSGIRILVN